LKALWHPNCSTLRSPPADGTWITCQCGKAAARWRDPTKGLFEVAELGDQFRDARIIGFHNAWLLADRAVAANPMASDEWVTKTAEILAATPDNYLFKRRNSPVVVIAPGETGDTFRMPWGAFLATQPDGSGG
jgi:hypothetical protein